MPKNILEAFKNLSSVENVDKIKVSVIFEDGTEKDISWMAQYSKLAREPMMTRALWTLHQDILHNKKEK